MVHLAQRHLPTHVLAERYEGDSDDGERLVERVLLLGVEMLAAEVEHALDLEHVARPGVRAHVDEDPGLPADRVLDRPQGLDNRLRRILPPCTPKLITQNGRSALERP